jgi:hypothetical protein
MKMRKEGEFFEDYGDRFEIVGIANDEDRFVEIATEDCQVATVLLSSLRKFLAWYDEPVWRTCRCEFGTHKNGNPFMAVDPTCPEHGIKEGQ